MTVNEQAMTGEQILTLDEAAEFMKVAPETLLSLLESQEVAGRILEGSWRTTTRALLNYVDGRSAGADCFICCPPGSDSKGCCSGKPGCC